MLEQVKEIFRLSASAAATEFCEWVQVGIDVYIPLHKYQAKPHLSSWFSAAIFQQLFYSMAQRSSKYDKANLFARMFSKNYNLLDLGISLPVFHSRTNLKLHNISITSKLVKKVITNLDSS